LEQQLAAPAQGLQRKPSSSRLEGGEVKEQSGGAGGAGSKKKAPVPRRSTFAYSKSAGGDLMLYSDVELDMVARQLGIKR
jgi:hypothetical protein